MTRLENRIKVKQKFELITHVPPLFRRAADNLCKLTMEVGPITEPDHFTDDIYRQFPVGKQSLFRIINAKPGTP